MAAGESEAALARLLQLVRDYEAGRLEADGLRAALTSEADLRALVRRGGKVERGGTVIDFGAGSQMGDVHIRDAAGRDIVNLTINLHAQAPTLSPGALDDEEIAHKRALIAQHRKMLNALELQAAQFGIYAPAHITIEIGELKRKLAELRRELGEG